MANIISDETIEYVGILAKLELNEEEKEQAKKDMGAMLDYIDKLNELDTTGVEPMSHVFPVTNVFREDVVTNGDGSEATLSNAPSRSTVTKLFTFFSFASIASKAAVTASVTVTSFAFIFLPNSTAVKLIKLISITLSSLFHAHIQHI